MSSHQPSNASTRNEFKDHLCNAFPFPTRTQQLSYFLNSSQPMHDKRVAQSTEGYWNPGCQHPTGDIVMNDAYFLRHDAWSRLQQESDFDLVIVGSGFCGYAVAERALRNKPSARILVLESGPFFLADHFQNLPAAYRHILEGAVETFPWTLDAKASSEERDRVLWNHGMVPFFGGRSIIWSGWCPVPMKKELEGWPSSTQKAILNYVNDAMELLSVIKIDESIELKLSESCPLFGKLQKWLEATLASSKNQVPGIYRAESAKLAADYGKDDGIDFAKFAVPEKFLDLIMKKHNDQQDNENLHQTLKIVTECTVQKIVQAEKEKGDVLQQRQAKALLTSKGLLQLGDAKLVLAMGTLPPTTIVRNSFREFSNIGKRFSSHFLTLIVAQVSVDHLKGNPDEFKDLELGACYVAGIANHSYKQQFHIQMSAIWDKHPEKNERKAFRYMPDVMSTASMAQLSQSQNCVIFNCAVVGELDVDNVHNRFEENHQDPNLATNSLLHVTLNKIDEITWETMDTATFNILEKVISDDPSHVKYWHESNGGEFTSERPSEKERRVNALVHESSTMHIGDENDKNAPVDLDYKLKGTENVYITGGALWPRGGSWNPTLAMVAMAQDLVDKIVPREGCWDGFQNDD